MSEPTPETTPAAESPAPEAPAAEVTEEQAQNLLADAVEQPAETPKPAAPPAAPQSDPAPDPAPAADDDWSDPERGKEAKRKANQEAKKLRGEIESLKKQLEERVDPDEAKAAIALVEAESARQVARIRYGHQYGLPDAVVERLKGDTAEEIEADAKALATHFNPTAGLGRGGLDPTEQPTETDPMKLAAQIPRLH